MKTATASCKTCRFLGVEPGARITRKAYRCLWIEEPRDLPISITRAAGYTKNPARTSVWPEEGADCPTWEERT